MLVEMSPIQRDIYEALRNQYAGQFDLARADRATLARMGRVVMYLLEAVTNPALLMAGSDDDLDRIEFRHPPIDAPPGSPLRNLIEEYASYETPSKFEKLATLIHERAEAGRKTLVWTNFVRNIATLERMLARYRPAAIHGGIPSKESQPMAPRTREDELARFRTDPECLVVLANPAATSEGVSLHDVCHDAVYLDRTFNAGQYLQSVDRIHRLGLAPGVTTTVTFLITRGSVDELVDDRVRTKAERLGRMLDDPDMVIMALPDEDDYGPAIDSAADLASLFAHLRGDDGAAPP
jgi:SNF2 family DNA or RNA helicase